MMRAFNRYALISGMPEAISVYAETKDIEALSPVYNSLLQGYNEDVEKYAKNQEQAKTPAPENSPYTLINVPFCYVGQLCP